MSTYSTWNSDSGNIRNLAEELEDQQAMALAREAALNRRLRGLEGDMQKRVDASAHDESFDSVKGQHVVRMQGK